MGNRQRQGEVIGGSVALIVVALVTISLLGVFGEIPGVPMGGAFVGLSIPLALLSGGITIGNRDTEMGLISGACLIISLTLIVLGSLTIAGIIGSESLGWVIVLPLVICCTALGRS